MKKTLAKLALALLPIFGMGCGSSSQGLIGALKADGLDGKVWENRYLPERRCKIVSYWGPGLKIQILEFDNQEASDAAYNALNGKVCLTEVNGVRTTVKRHKNGTFHIAVGEGDESKVMKVFDAYLKK